MSYFIGVDVGTGSVRAALVSNTGRLLSTHIQPIKIWEPCTNCYEQSTADIWNSVSICIKNVIEGVDVSKVKGIGFDATCSLVVIGHDGHPLTISSSGSNEQNVIMWLDHRAEKQMHQINSTKHPLLSYVGNRISPEMSLTKVLWLKQNMSENWWKRVGHFMELPDFLTWRASGSTTRSVGCVGTKWLYKENSWNREFLENIGLGELAKDDFSKIGAAILKPGDLCGTGLTKQSADELGLSTNTSVSTGIIDAHAGGVGCIGCTVSLSPEINVPLVNRMVLVNGTSTCHMVVKDKEVAIDGVWGPDYSAIISGMWNHEGGQSVSGKLIDHLIQTHVAYPSLLQRAEAAGTHIHTELDNILQDLTKKNGLHDVSLLTKDFHMWPDYHGNRSPIADSTLTGMISGLTLSCDLEALAVLYLVGIQALAYGTKHILETLTMKGGYDIKVIYACGGLCKNRLYMQVHSDISGLPIVLPHETESVLLGSAILGAMSSLEYPTMQVAMDAMCGDGDVIRPNKSVCDFHRKKYKVFRLMVDHQQQYRKIMNSE